MTISGVLHLVHVYILDEENCGEDEFRCTAGDCIHISQVCDFIVDCTDASDEFCGKKDNKILKSCHSAC
jgi:hypothetical protein